MAGEVLEVFLGGFDISSICLEGSWTPKLNQPRQAQVKIPMSERPANTGAGSRLKIVLDSEIVFHGFVQLVETEADEDVGYAVYNAEDIYELWRWRPVRDSDGDYSYPTIMQDFGGIGGGGTGGAPTVIEQMIINSETAIATADEGIVDGPLFIDYSLGTFPLGGVDVSGAPVDWPMTMMELSQVLVSTGELDLVFTPVDYGGYMATIDTYHGDYGEDLQSEVIFEYGSGFRNIRSFRHTEDFSNVINKLRYLLGPREHPPVDPKGHQHWGGSIQTNGSLRPDPPASDVDFRQQLSRNKYGTRFEIQIWDSNEAGENNFRDLFYRLHFIESWLRAEPRTLVSFTPTRDTEINTFKAGDIVGVNLYGTAFPGGVFGAQRVYGYTISWDQDSVLALTNITTSADNESYPG
jgi:hypothetical protein